MNHGIFLTACAAVCAIVMQAGAAEPAFDPRSFKDRIEGPPTRVFVLGSPHLSSAGDDFDDAVLEPLLARLWAFHPSVIAIENLSGESVFALNAYAGTYPEVADSYGSKTIKIAKLAEAETGLSMPAAEAEARRLLSELPRKPKASDRRRLAAVFAASGDPYSALVQWKRLAPRERKAGDGVSGELAKEIDAFGERRNESIKIGAELAARLKLERVYPTDDHSSDDIVIPIAPALEAAMAEDPLFKEKMADPLMKRFVGASRQLTSPDEALATYRFLNSDEAVIADPSIQWLYFLQSKMPDRLGRKRMAEWEARNLRMIAHIREAFAQHPGENVLVVVGSAHKPYFDAYLNMMHDVDVVDADEVLN